ncbi:ankyrin repeat domain-containing protein [Pseudomonadota bacterium]
MIKGKVTRLLQNSRVLIWSQSKLFPIVGDQVTLYYFLDNTRMDIGIWQVESVKYPGGIVAAPLSFYEEPRQGLFAEIYTDNPQSKTSGNYPPPSSKALMRAAKKGDVAKITRFVAAGIDVNSLGRRRLTPLMEAAKGGHLPAVKQLLSLGANINHRAVNDESALLAAASKGHIEVVRVLIAEGAEISTYGDSGQLLLVVAIMSGKIPLIRFIIETEVDINGVLGNVPISKFQHVTPLMVAAEKGDVEIVRILLDAGADIDATNLNGETALDLARKKKRSEVVTLLSASTAQLKSEPATSSQPLDVKEGLQSLLESLPPDIRRNHQRLLEFV